MSAQVIELPLRQRSHKPALRPEIRDLIDRMTSQLGDHPDYETLPGGLTFGAWCPVPDRSQIVWLSGLPDIGKVWRLLDTIMPDRLLRAGKAGWVVREDQKWLQ